MKKLRIAVVAIVFICFACLMILPNQEKEIVVYYTNDIHSYIDNNAEDENGLTYSKIAALKSNTDGALLVDAGDHIQWRYG